VLLEEKGPALRGAFIIDPDGVLRSACVHDEGSEAIISLLRSPQLTTANLLLLRHLIVSARKQTPLLKGGLLQPRLSY